MTDVENTVAATPPPAETELSEQADQAVEVLELNVGDVEALSGDLVAELRRFRYELAVAFGFRGYEDKKLPADLRALLDELDDLASVIRDSAEGADRALNSLVKAL